MRAGKRIFCGIMAGILVMMGPVNGYAGTGNSKIAESGRIIAKTAAGAEKPGECHEDHDADPDLRCPAVREDPLDG